MCCLDRSIQAALTWHCDDRADRACYLVLFCRRRNLPGPSVIDVALPPQRTNLRSLQTPPAPPDPHSFESTFIHRRSSTSSTTLKSPTPDNPARTPQHHAEPRQPPFTPSRPPLPPLPRRGATRRPSLPPSLASPPTRPHSCGPQRLAAGGTTREAQCQADSCAPGWSRRAEYLQDSRCFVLSLVYRFYRFEHRCCVHDD